MLDQLVSKSITDRKYYTQSDISKELGDPTTLGRNKNGKIINLHYFFNNRRYPTCKRNTEGRESNLTDYNNGSILTFVLDESGKLISISSGGLHP